jgi:hypothetical protein
MNEGDKQMSQMCLVLKLLAVSISNIEQALKVPSTIARAPSAQERELVLGSGAQGPPDGGQLSGDGPRSESEEEIWEHALNPPSEPTYKHGGRHKAHAGQRQQQQASSGSGITSEQLAALLTGFRGDMEVQVHKIVSRQMEKLLGQVQKTVPALVASELGMAGESKGRAKGTLEAATSPLKAESKVEEEEAALHIQSGLRPAGEAASEMIQRQQELDTKLDSLLQTVGALRALQEEILSVCQQSYTLKEQDWMRDMLDKALQSADDAPSHEHEHEHEHINSDVTTSSDDQHQHLHPPRRHHRTHRHTSRTVKAASDNKVDAARSNALRTMGARSTRRRHSITVGGDELQDWGPVRNAAGMGMAVPRQARDGRAPDAAQGASGGSAFGAPHRSPRSGLTRPEQQRGAGAMTWQHSVRASPPGVATRGADTVMVSLAAPPNAYPRFSTAPVTAPGHNAALHAVQDPARRR